MLECVLSDLTHTELTFTEPANLAFAYAIACVLPAFWWQAVEAAVHSAVQDATVAAKEQAELEADARQAAADQQLLRELEDQNRMLAEQMHVSVDQLRATEARLRFPSFPFPGSFASQHIGAGLIAAAPGSMALRTTWIQAQIVNVGLAWEDVACSSGRMNSK